MSELLSVENLKVYFHSQDGTSRAVDGVSYEVRKGETVCLVGESGCGKTVSTLSILGLIPTPPGEIVDGKIMLLGKNLLDLDDEAMERIRGNRVAMVFQEPMTSLNPVFTIGDQIMEAIRIHKKVGAEELRQRCIKLLQDVGIPSPESRLRDYPHQLSGGQRQRAMIAMALSCDPDLIIADEPTTALDVTIQAQILKLFRELKESRSMSLLYITHDLRVVANIADRVYVMYAGIVAEQGNASQIFNQPQHPYTQGLLASLPDRSRRGNRLYSIPGTVPDPARKPQGCPFHTRCPHALPICREASPHLCDYGNGHMARCPVLYGDVKEGSKANWSPL
jgi:oligopeptide/dipeptide ABC transporter ATP-binding protein